MGSRLPVTLEQRGRAGILPKACAPPAWEPGCRDPQGARHGPRIGLVEARKDRREKDQRKGAKVAASWERWEGSWQERRVPWSLGTQENERQSGEGSREEKKLRREKTQKPERKVGKVRKMKKK